jgi:hypothetical protein
MAARHSAQAYTDWASRDAHCQNARRYLKQAQQCRAKPQDARHRSISKHSSTLASSRTTAIKSSTLTGAIWPVSLQQRLFCGSDSLEMNWGLLSSRSALGCPNNCGMGRGGGFSWVQLIAWTGFVQALGNQQNWRYQHLPSCGRACQKNLQENAVTCGRCQALPRPCQSHLHVCVASRREGEQLQMQHHIGCAFQEPSNIPAPILIRQPCGIVCRWAKGMGAALLCSGSVRLLLLSV